MVIIYHVMNNAGGDKMAYEEYVDVCTSCNEVTEIINIKIIEDMCLGHGIISSKTHYLDVSECCEADYRTIKEKDFEDEQ
tara:strand:+ start:1570 stop:1809 length:240 start_codon:yes stop_codon:yes gene_type:complete